MGNEANLRVVVIGGVAAGMSAASQAKRRMPGAEVIVIERGPFISYGACGMPYNLEDPSREMEDLVVLTPEVARKKRGIDVRTKSEVLAIDTERKRVRYREDGSEVEEELHYDRLIIATGARPVVPPFPGTDLPGVFLLRELDDGIAIKRFVAEKNVKKAIIVGGGYIGLEMADGLRGRGVEVHIIEMRDRVAAGFSAKPAELAAEELERHGVGLSLETRVEAIESSADHRLRVKTDKGDFEGDMVLLSIGIRPNRELAEAAGIAIGETGAIAVDEMQRTNIQDVFAAGDCAEARHRVTNAPTYIPLGPTANKQGKIAGANAVGAGERFAGIVGTAAFKVFDIELARTGLSLEEAERAGLSAFESSSEHGTRGHGYPGGGRLHTTLIVERGTGRLLGAQLAGDEGAAGRVNVYAAALASGATVGEIASYDLAYAPPFAPVYDPILIAATVAQKDLARQR
ncbi:MAG: FAD-dependent oxidoreductase [Sandaracinaceae bacterium]|nr:FAD-dependent oxidoreductase [Sandaracinaceae bacterium]